MAAERAAVVYPETCIETLLRSFPSIALRIPTAHNFKNVNMSQYTRVTVVAVQILISEMRETYNSSKCLSG